MNYELPLEELVFQLRPASRWSRREDSELGHPAHECFRQVGERIGRRTHDLAEALLVEFLQHHRVRLVHCAFSVHHGAAEEPQGLGIQVNRHSKPALFGWPRLQPGHRK